MSAMMIKLVFALVIFITAYSAGFYTLYRSEKINLNRGIGFASGVFLGTAFFHLMPNAIKHFRIVSHSQYPWSFIICIATILLMLMISKLTKRLLANEDKPNLFSGISITLLLSLHSVIAGASLGLSKHIGTAVVIFIAIMSHKAAASFALMMHLLRVHYPKKLCHYILSFFSLMTPIGIILGNLLSLVLYQQSSEYLEAVFYAAAAGTFIYIAVFEYLVRWLKLESRIFWHRVLFCLVGTVLMAIITIWI